MASSLIYEGLWTIGSAKKVISSDTTHHDTTAEINWHVKGGRGVNSSRHTTGILRIKNFLLNKGEMLGKRC